MHNNSGREHLYAMKSLAQLVDLGSNRDEILNQISTVYQDSPTHLAHPGNDFGTDEKWERLMAQLSSYVFCLLHSSKGVVGYWSCFPISERIYRDGIIGKNINAEIDTTNIDEFGIPGDYLGYFVDFYVQNQHNNTSTKRMLFLSMVDFLIESAKDGYFFSKVFAHTATDFSVNLCEHVGFTKEADHVEHVMLSKKGDIVPTRVYSLDLFKSPDNALFRLNSELVDLYSIHFGNTHERVLDKGLRALDIEIEKIELAIRKLIGSRLGNDTDKIPTHIRPKLNERIKTEIKRYPDSDTSRLATLEGMLEFADISELEGIIISKDCERAFSGLFPTKELMIARFGQLTGLRNSIRHSRAVSEIARLEGQAAIRYFEAILRKAV